MRNGMLRRGEKEETAVNGQGADLPPSPRAPIASVGFSTEKSPLSTSNARRSQCDPPCPSRRGSLCRLCCQLQQLSPGILHWPKHYTRRDKRSLPTRIVEFRQMKNGVSTIDARATATKMPAETQVSITISSTTFPRGCTLLAPDPSARPPLSTWLGPAVAHNTMISKIAPDVNHPLVPCRACRKVIEPARGRALSEGG